MKNICSLLLAALLTACASTYSGSSTAAASVVGLLTLDEALERAAAYVDSRISEMTEIAIADYTQAIRIDPNYASAYNNRGSAYSNKNDYDRAIADYEAALRINPNYTNARNNLELARQRRGY